MRPFGPESAIPLDAERSFLPRFAAPCPQPPPRDPLLDKCHEWTAKRSGCSTYASGDAREPRSAPCPQEACIRAHRWLVAPATTQTHVKPADSPSTQIGRLTATPATRLTARNGLLHDEPMLDRVRTTPAPEPETVQTDRSNYDDNETTQTRMQRADVNPNVQKYFPTISGTRMWNGSSYYRVWVADLTRMAAFWSDLRYGIQPEFRETGDSPRDPWTDQDLKKKGEWSGPLGNDAGEHAELVPETYIQRCSSWTKRCLALATTLVCLQLADNANSDMQKDRTVRPGMRVWIGATFRDFRRYFRRLWLAAVIVSFLTQGSVFGEEWTWIQVTRDQAVGRPLLEGFPGQMAPSDSRNLRPLRASLKPVALAVNPRPSAGQPNLDELASDVNITWLDYIWSIKTALKGPACRVENAREKLGSDTDNEGAPVPETPSTGFGTLPQYRMRWSTTARAAAATSSCQPATLKQRAPMEYRSNYEKKVKDRVHAATIESEPDSSSGEDGEPEEIQMAVNLDDVHIKA